MMMMIFFVFEIKFFILNTKTIILNYDSIENLYKKYIKLTLKLYIYIHIKGENIIIYNKIKSKRSFFVVVVVVVVVEIKNFPTTTEN